MPQTQSSTILPSFVLDPGDFDVADDLAEEAETIPDDPSSQDSTQKTSQSPNKRQRSDGKDSMANILEAASQAVQEKTKLAYRGLMNSFNQFCVEQGYILAGTNIFVKKLLNPQTDLWIIGWLMKHCDVVDMWKNPRQDQPGSWSHAMKMRSAMTRGFGIEGGRGSTAWNSTTGEGNPSLSLVLAQYCRGLHRRKVQHYGETPTSARAITPLMIERLFLYNKQAQSVPPSDDWCGRSLRICLHAIYTLAFVCLLRVDEVLKIQTHDISWDIDKDGTPFVTLMLPFRKTHQFGDIKPFVIRKFPVSMAHLCPVRALSNWISCSQLKQGFVFRKMNKAHEPILMKNEPMTAEFFLQYFRNNLMDIGIDGVYPYGTHSFRRGGCQWLSVDLRWPLRQICDWGGWSMDFSHLTIVKYLISWIDDAMLPRKDFFNFERPPAMKCFTCNRSCHCA